jgi:intergrase/recombinase
MTGNDTSDLKCHPFYERINRYCLEWIKQNKKSNHIWIIDVVTRIKNRTPKIVTLGKWVLR